MSFINMALADVREAVVVPEGEYDLRINEAEIVDSKNKEKGGQNIVCTVFIESSEYPKAAPIMHYMSLPNEKDEPRSIEFKMLQAKRFLHAFSIPFEENGFDVDDFAGATGRSLVVQENMKDKEGNETNDKRNSLKLPRLPSGDDGDEEEVDTKIQKSTGARRRR